MMLTVSPARYKTPAIVSFVPQFDLALAAERWADKTRYPSASSSAMTSPSVQWSSVSFRLNSRAMRTAVRISSARGVHGAIGICIPRQEHHLQLHVQRRIFPSGLVVAVAMVRIGSSRLRPGHSHARHGALLLFCP